MPQGLQSSLDVSYFIGGKFGAGASSLEKSVTKEAICRAMKEAVEDELKGILGGGLRATASTAAPV